jgi:tyrosine-protein phosphatase SIW14
LNRRSNAAGSSYRRTWLACLAVALALASAAASASGGQTAAIDLENFGKVNENYYRGGQPRAEQYGELRRMGIKTILDLRKDRKTEAPEWARAAGLNYVNLPLKASQPATESETAEFLRVVNDPANWPVYVHCKGGRHRTGALTAVYRITNDGWTADQAFDEMLKYDFNNGSNISGLFGGGGRSRQKKFVYAYYERHAAAKDPARVN